MKKKEMKELIKMKKELKKMENLDLYRLFYEVSDGIHMDTYIIDELITIDNIRSITVHNSTPNTQLRIICGRESNSQTVSVAVTTNNNFTMETYLNEVETESFIKMEVLIYRYLFNNAPITDPFIITIYP